ncbi:MAG: hypothetical protein I8H75_05135 [Myxococcaceae bacterium]|nr:hypothetical protein [Myxococcaceae bacterium]MBH2006707.1 hypothetical protein [Myxococcaceae bacterium]
MIKLLFLSMFCFGLLAGPLEDARDSFINLFKELKKQSKIPSDAELESLYATFERYLDLLESPGEEQVNQWNTISKKLGVSDRVGQGYVARYLSHRQAIDNRRSMARQVSMAAPSLARSYNPFDVVYTQEERLARLRGDLQDLQKSKGKYVSARREALNLLIKAQDPELTELEYPRKSVENAVSWLEELAKKGLNREADRAELDADQVSQFVIRFQAIQRLVERSGFHDLGLRLSDLIVRISSSQVVAAKFNRAGSILRRGESVAPALGSFSASTLPSSRHNSYASMASHRHTAVEREEVLRSAVARIGHASTEVQVEDNLGSGDCMFLALGTTRDAFEQNLRRHYRTHRTWFDDVLAHSIQAGEIEGIDGWLSAIHNGQWGGELELHVFGLLNHVRIVVFTEETDDNFVLRTQNNILGDLSANEEIWIGFIGRNHYVRLRPVQPYTIADTLFKPRWDDRDPPPGGASGTGTRSLSRSARKRGRTESTTVHSPQGRSSGANRRSELKDSIELAFPSLLRLGAVRSQSIIR